nr:MAG TPA: Mor transcription activator family [Caudoviricetes sp.]
MKEELLNELVSETRMEDIAERYQEIVKIVGIANFVKLSNYARGDEIYFPKVESVVSPARNRRIKKEFNGSNDKELAEKYNLTLKQIWNILKDEPPIGQMTLDQMLGM